jgi:hypothetical protein
MGIMRGYNKGDDFLEEKRWQVGSQQEQKKVAASKNLKTLLKKVEKRDDHKNLWFDLVPKHLNFLGGVSDYGNPLKIARSP